MTELKYLGVNFLDQGYNYNLRMNLILEFVNSCFSNPENKYT